MRSTLIGSGLGILFGAGAIVAMVLVSEAGPVLTIQPSVMGPANFAVPMPNLKDLRLPVGLPTRLQVPSIGVDSRTVIPVGLDRHGAIGTPCDPEKPRDPCNLNASAWYAGSVKPGQPGNAIFDAHVDWYGPVGCHCDIPALFTYLDHVKVGDAIIVTDNLGRVRTFVVDSVSVLPYPTQPATMYASDGPRTVTLVTCAGTYVSTTVGDDHRTYVHATEVAGE